MLVNRPPMGWNSWNTFGEDINEQVIMEMADRMVADGYKDAGYKYVVIDDCWSLRERQNGKLVADPEKFPHGMKALADYIHSKGLKFGMYSCAGVMTCAGYPSSYDHEFVDAKTFASWGVDFLKYDFCNVPATANGPVLYHRMGLALESCGRDILFSACNWGVNDVYKWIRSTGAHMYRSTGDINDNFHSFTDIANSQFDKLYASAPQCYNDMDMLVVGMGGKGNVANGGCSDLEYQTHFALWCLCGVPLMMGNDLRIASDATKATLLNKELLAIDQDIANRTPYRFAGGDSQPCFIRHMEKDYVLAYFNFTDGYCGRNMCFADLGLPYGSGMAFDLTDVMTGEEIKNVRDYFVPAAPAHGFKMYRAKLVKAK